MRRTRTAPIPKSVKTPRAESDSSVAHSPNSCWGRSRVRKGSEATDRTSVRWSHTHAATVLAKSSRRPWSGGLAFIASDEGGALRSGGRTSAGAGTRSSRPPRHGHSQDQQDEVLGHHGGDGAPDEHLGEDAETDGEADGRRRRRGAGQPPPQPLGEQGDDEGPQGNRK